MHSCTLVLLFAHCDAAQPKHTMGECVSVSVHLRQYISTVQSMPHHCHCATVYCARCCIYWRLLRYRLTPQCRVDYWYYTSQKQCLLTLLSQLLLSLKLLPPLHSCRSTIVRVKRYSYCFVNHSSLSTYCTHSYRRLLPRPVPSCSFELISTVLLVPH